jgi:hypothetical protein
MRWMGGSPSWTWRDGEGRAVGAIHARGQRFDALVSDVVVGSFDSIWAAKTCVETTCEVALADAVAAATQPTLLRQTA